MAKPIEVKLRPKGQALGFGVRHRDDEWDKEKSSRVKVGVSLACLPARGVCECAQMPSEERQPVCWDRSP